MATQPGGLCGPQRTLEGPQSTVGLCRTPTQFPSVFWPQALGCKWGREGSSSVRRERRQEGRQVWLREIPDFHLLCNTVFLAKPSRRAAGDPEQAELVVGPGHSADVWGVLSPEEGPVSQV